MTERGRWAFVAYAALVGAALHGLAHPPTGSGPAALLAHALPLGALARARRGEEARLGGLLFGTVAYALPLRWLAAIFGPAALALWLVFGLLHLALFHVLFVVRERRGVGAMLLAAPVALVGLECFRSEWWMLRFPWATPGLAQIHDPLVGQSADVFGSYGLSLFAYGASAALAGAAVLRQPRLLALALACWAVPALVGGVRAASIEPDEGPPLEAAVAQYETNDLDDALALAAEIPDPVELAVFPELGAALDGGGPRHEDALAPRFAELARRARATVVIGATEAAPGGDFFNSLVVVAEDGERLATYHKAEPVPLFADGVRSGPSPAVTTPLGRLGLCICYDFTHPHVVARALEDAELAVVASGDLASWTPLQHEEHRLIARFRAIEHRRWVVRATSSGTSHVIDPLGVERASLGFGERGVRAATVHLRTDRPPAAWLGMGLPYACLLATLGLSVWSLWPRRGRG